MCRLAAYVGPPRTLHSLWLAPEHSLEVQSYAPREMKTAVLNADGFGMSWYSDAEDGPARYRTILPLWADENVRSMSKHLVTRCAVANVRSATVGMPVQLSNVSPFVEGRWTFTHNGFLRAFHPRFARKIRESLDDARYGSIVGNTDSEHLFAHLMTRLAGHDSDPTGIVADWIGEVAAMATEKALLNVIVTDGRWLVAVRHAVHGEAPSLYERARDGAVEVVSEPLDGDGWAEVASGSVLTVTPDGAPLVPAALSLDPGAIAARLDDARAETLRFVEDLDDEALCAWPDEGFSPIGWHLGHVAFTEAQWLLGQCAGRTELFEPHVRAWSQGGCPKAERRQQPPKAELLGYLARVRDAALEVLPDLDLEGDDPLQRAGFVGWFVEAHERQHQETMAIVRQLALEVGAAPPPPPSLEGAPRFVAVDGGAFTMGTDGWLAYDNERGPHRVEVAPFELSGLATVGAWDAFRAGGGYDREALWSAEGWAWRRATGAEHPRGWSRDASGALSRWRLDGRLHALPADEPVVGVSFHEAEAFARFHEARLPTEAEWELAARATDDDALGGDRSGPRPEAAGARRGNAWAWTSTTFAPYDGFEPFPYRGYSAPYFDGAHRVLRGGSFVSHPAVARVTFRNWYEPHVRQIFAGVRLAR